MLDVSVVIPHFNNKDQIVRAYNSIMKQTQLPTEIIIVDDGSQDLTYLKKIEEQHNNLMGVSLKIFYFEKNQGPSEARNFGVEHSMSQYIAFLDSDDVWHPQKLEIVVSVLFKNNLDFIYHDYSFFPLSFESFYDIESIAISKKSKFLFAFKTYIFTPSVVIKKDIFSQFPVEMTHSEDYCCWLMSNKEEFFYYINLPLANGFKKPIGESGLTSDIYKMHKGFIRALIYLRNKKHIGVFFFLVAFIMEYLKFPLRYMR